MTDHSQKWLDGSSNRNIDSSCNSEGIAAIVSKQDNLGRDMKNLKENVYAIQVGCQTYRGAHLDKEFRVQQVLHKASEGKSGEWNPGVSCDGSPKASNSSLLNSCNATINMPQILYNVDAAATFGVPLTTVGDLDMLIKDIKAGKHDESLSGMTNDKQMAVIDALGAICDTIKAENSIPSNSTPSDPIMQFVDINNNPASYARAVDASAKDQTKVNSNFRPLVADSIFDGVNISIPRKVVKKVKLHDVPIQVFEKDGISLIATFIGKPIMVDSYTSSMYNDSWGKSSFARFLIEVNLEVDLMDAVTIGIPSLTMDDFTKETIRVEYE
ncbi:hypothetical protein Tco_0169155 [Tanacetum coccineum]